jgi:hypothetical protein
MSSLMRRLALPVLFAAAALLLLPAAPARAQGGCGQGMNRTRGGTMPGQSPLVPQQNALSQQSVLTALLQQLRQQQLALMVAQPQAPLNAMMVAQLRQPPQNAMPLAQPQQPPPAAQVRLQAAPVDDPPAVPPLKPEEAAARKLDTVRDLLADSRTARQNGEAARATRMQARAAERLRDLVATYPGTWAAGKAQDLLDDLAP